MSKHKSFMSRNVLMTGLTSFFTDISSEMLYPLLQAFVRSLTLSAGPVIGVIEGFGESIASILKVFSGYYSDKINKRKSLAIFGYFLSSTSKLLLFIPNVFSVLFFRFFDRVGKGIRTAPRDALISESVPRSFLGKAFGFQRGMDFAGAFLGAGTLYVLLRYVYPDLNKIVNGTGIVAPQMFFSIIAIAVVFSFIGVIFLFFTRDEKEKDAIDVTAGKDIAKPNLDIRKYNLNLKLFFVSQIIFTLGNSSNQFLLLQSTNIWGNLQAVVLMYVVFNLTTSLTSTFFGGLSDKIGRRKLLIAGYFIYAVVYIAFGLIDKNNSWLLWVFWPLYGLFYAMTEGVEKAFVAETAPKNSKATALGFYNTVVGVFLLPASIIAGFLFQFNSKAPFIFGGAMALVAVVIIKFFVKEPRVS
jgi:MFS family permease